MRKHGKPFAQAMLAFGMAAAVLAGPVDARRGGSFGSRGSRTYSSPQSTRLSPGYTPGVSRSMTSRGRYQSPAYAPTPSYGAGGYGQRPGMFRGFGGGLLTGVIAGGLLGSLFDHHGGGGGYGSQYGGGGGFLASLIQIAILGGIVWLIVGFFRRRRENAPSQRSFFEGVRQNQEFEPSTQAYSASASPSGGSDIALSADDQATFERLLIELQSAFGAEDYGRLRAITTPEVMSYLAEELSDNATHGRRNDVTGTRLLEGEVSEAWREGDAEYATIVMRYEGIDVMRDRNTRMILSGDPGHPTETTEFWTFVRPVGSHSAWKVSAIQEG